MTEPPGAPIAEGFIPRKTPTYQERHFTMSLQIIATVAVLAAAAVVVLLTCAVVHSLIEAYQRHRTVVESTDAGAHRPERIGNSAVTVTQLTTDPDQPVPYRLPAEDEPIPYVIADERTDDEQAVA